MCTDGVQGDIHEVTKNMVESHIKDSSMVILVVIPAMTTSVMQSS